MRSRNLLVFLAVLLVSVRGFPQMDRGSLSGTVTDSTGAVVPGAVVNATHVSTQTKLTTETTGVGTYNFTGLAVGHYTVSAEKTGFRTVVFNDVLITQQSNVRVDFTLQPGAVTQTVEVTAPAPLVEERSASYGVSVLTSTLNDLPIQVAGSKRSLYSYLSTVPGVQNAGFQNNVMGSVGMNSEVVIDGVSAEYNPGVAGVASNPQSVEALAEFKVVSSVNAEYGLTGGAFMNYVTKSGTNTLHGNVYEYLRNDALDARNFFSPTVPFDRQDEFGFSLGGPFVIPHVYNGRNKTFFFWNYNYWLYHSTSAASVYTIPTTAMTQRGDFSALLGQQIGTDALGRPVMQGAIYDPKTTRTLADGVTVVRDAYPGNIIPPGDFSSVSANLQSYYPTPTTSGITNNFLGQSGFSTNHTADYFIRVDQNLLGGILTGSLKEDWNGGLGSSTFNPILQSGWDSHGNVPNVRIAFTRNINPTMVNSINAGMDRMDGIGGPLPPMLNGSTTIGLKNPFSTCTPWFSIAGGYPDLGERYCGQRETDTNFKVNEFLTKIQGKHTLKMGASYFHWTANFVSVERNNGHALFVPAETGLPGFSGTGYGYASFLLGQVDNGTLWAPFHKELRNFYTGMFIQDEWRVTPKLTVSYGLRYEIQPQYINNNDAGSQFNPTIPNEAAGGLLGATEYLGYGQGKANTRRFGNTYYKGFGPRLGFAYRVTPNTVFRASYGLFDGPVSQFSGELGPRQGYQPAFSWASPDAGISPSFNWDSGWPTHVGDVPVSATPNLTPTANNGSGTAFMGPESAHPAFITIVNASVQREIPGNILFEVAYLGNFAHHIPNGALEQVNQLDYAKYGSLGSLLNADVYSPAAAAAGIKVPFPGFVGTVAQALRPYPQYLGINGQNSTIGNQTYNALQIKAQKHFSNGLSFLVGYTWSKAITDVGSTPGYFARGVQNAYDRRLEKAPSDVDVPHQLVASYTYELPFGKGKKFVNGGSPVTEYLLGGWTIAGIHTYQSGMPLAPSTEIMLPTSGDSMSLSASPGPARPNVVPGVAPTFGLGCGGSFNPQTRYLNPAAFTNPAPLSFGNAAPLYTNMRSCATAREDLSLLKAIPIKERLRLQFGADFFNAFNRVGFGGLNTDLDSSAYGYFTSAGSARSIQLHMKLIW